MAKTNGKKEAAKSVAADAAKRLEEAKKKFAESQKKLAEKKKKIAAARRLIATADKKVATMEKKISEAQDAPTKAAEMLLKKAEEMEAKVAEMEAAQEDILKEAEEKEAVIAEKEAQLKEAEAEAKAELEAMGVSTRAARTASSGDASIRRAKNNFQYRLKSKGWLIDYNAKGRVQGASNYGLTVEFGPEEFTVTGGTLEQPFSHPYGQNSLTALTEVVEKHGEGVEA